MRFNMYLQKSFHNRLKEMAAANGMSVSQYIRYALMRSGDLCLVMKNNSTMFSIKPAETFTIQGDRKRLEELLQKLNPLIKEI